MFCGFWFLIVEVRVLFFMCAELSGAWSFSL